MCIHLKRNERVINQSELVVTDVIRINYIKTRNSHKSGFPKTVPYRTYCEATDKTMFVSF